MPTLTPMRPISRAALAMPLLAAVLPAHAAARETAAADLSPWLLGGVLLALCVLAVYRWFRRLPDEVEQAGGWGSTLRGVTLRNAVAAVVAWQLGAGVFRGVLARYANADTAGPMLIAMPIALAAATVGFLVVRWLMVFAQRAWRRRRGFGA